MISPPQDADQHRMGVEVHEVARSVQDDRKISDYVEVGGMAAAILSSYGRVYTGVCG